MKSTKDHVHISSYNQSKELKETTSLTIKKAQYHKHLKDHSTTVLNTSFKSLDKTLRLKLSNLKEVKNFFKHATSGKKYFRKPNL